MSVSMSMSIGMHHLYSPNEIPGYFHKGTYPLKEETRSHIGRPNPVSFKRRA